VLGREEESRASFDEGIAMHRRRTPEGSVTLATALWQSGNARLESGDPQGALGELEEAAAMMERLLVPESPALSDCRATLAECRTALVR
jgi:hypothetical protein